MARLLEWGQTGWARNVRQSNIYRQARHLNPNVRLTEKHTWPTRLRAFHLVGVKQRRENFLSSLFDTGQPNEMRVKSHGPNGGQKLLPGHSLRPTQLPVELNPGH